MSYEISCSRNSPALVIFLLDLSASLNQFPDTERRTEIINRILLETIKEMVARSIKGMTISPRYNIAILGYSNVVYDLLGGIRPLIEVAKNGIPEITPQDLGYTSVGFLAVEILLKDQLPKLMNNPAPSVIHITGGKISGDDPEPVAARIKGLRNVDGNILIENVYLPDPKDQEDQINDSSWSGISDDTFLNLKHGNKLRAMSSTLPENYRDWMNNLGYNLKVGCKMMVPANRIEFVKMGIQLPTSDR